MHRKWAGRHSTAERAAKASSIWANSPARVAGKPGTLLRQLTPLALAMFAVGTGGFVIAGLLTEISTDLQVGVSAAGQLITVFALAFAISAPILGALTSAMDRRKVLLVALTIFVVGNAATALGPTYPIVMSSRVITAIGAGLIGSAAFSAAAAIAPQERQGDVSVDAP